MRRRPRFLFSPSDSLGLWTRHGRGHITLHLAEGWHREQERMPLFAGWCLRSGGCAQFFGGQASSSPYALMWQWSGGGGIRNGVGDFDQIDGARQG